MNIRTITLISSLTAICIAIQLTPRPPNVELTSLISFITGMVFGSIIGSLVGALTMIVNGFLSPWGMAGLILPFQAVSMGFIGAVGGFYGKKVRRMKASLCLECLILGAFLTLLYDVITNIGFALAFKAAGTPLLAAITSTLVTGIPFAMTHIVWNSLIFGFVAIPASYSLRKFVSKAYA